MTLIGMIYYELGHNYIGYTQFVFCEVKRYIMFARFICVIILHMSLTDEVTDGLNRMKYACNHEFRFHNFTMAFIAGFF